jgi:uncharacterized protein YceH (UPF0502 family)
LATDIRLSAVAARVLGALVEKEITTPEYYPLSLNALVNACNQKTNREPVMNLDDDAVTAALRSLSDLELAGAADTNDSRVRKYEHRLGGLSISRGRRLRFCACFCCAGRRLRARYAGVGRGCTILRS